VPDHRQADVADTIVSKSMVRGTYGSFFALKSLYESHRGHAVLDLMTATDLPSWHNVIRSGVTITMESFDNSLKPNLDRNHAWASAPASIVPMYLMGVQPLEPGFGRIRSSYVAI
jgi:alpha-L-rhamnosidase